MFIVFYFCIFYSCFVHGSLFLVKSLCLKRVVVATVFTMFLFVLPCVLFVCLDLGPFVFPCLAHHVKFSVIVSFGYFQFYFEGICFLSCLTLTILFVCICVLFPQLCVTFMYILLKKTFYGLLFWTYCLQLKFGF